MKYLLFFIMIVLFSGCENSNKPKVKYDGAELLEKHCSICHNLDIPPKTSEDEKAPPMMAVAFHIKDFIKVDSPSEKKPKFIDFVQDYVITPSREKSFCDKKSLDSYGIMPSLKGQISKDELKAVAEYIYDYFDQERFMEQMQREAKLKAMKPGERIATKKGCFTCHDKTKKKNAPSFKELSSKSHDELKNSIKNGSKGKYKEFKNMFMPPFKNSLDDKKIDILIKWIKGL
jgi:cytochrome c